MFNILWSNKYLLLKLTRKDIAQRYKGSILGIIWLVVIPIIMLCIYTFVFSEIFQAKWGGMTQDKFDFALMLFCGLSAFNMIAEVMSRSCSLIANNTNYVKKVIFPLEILPTVITLSALFNCIISYLILILANLFLRGKISPIIMYWFLAVIPLILLCLGLSYLFSSISVYLKDMSNIISVLITILMYASPIFFSVENVPNTYRKIILFNVITPIVENLRNVMLNYTGLDWGKYLISLALTIVILVVGYITFKKTKEGFADVL